MRLANSPATASGPGSAGAAVAEVELDGVPGLPVRDGGEEPPQVVRLVERELPRGEPLEEAPVDGLDHVLGVDAPADAHGEFGPGEGE